MSTAPSLSSVDLLSPPSRGRGHSRSRGWAQSPASLSSSEQTAAQQTSAAPPYTNGHRLNTPWRDNIRPRSRSPLPREVGDPTTEESDVKAAQATSEPSSQLETSLDTADNSLFQNHEMIRGFLVTLPSIAISWFAKYYGQSNTSTAANYESDIASTCSSNNWSQSGCLRSEIRRLEQKACILTSATLLFTGGWQILKLQRQNLSFPAAFRTKLSQLDAKTAGALFLQICSVGLPIYAALKVGGFLVAFALSLALASGIPTMSRSNVARSFQARIMEKKWSVMSLAGAIVLSFLSLDGSWDNMALVGYVALLISVFALRPPFPGSQGPAAPESVLSLLSKGLDSSASPSHQRKISNSNFSPIIGPENAVLSVLSGGLLAIAVAVVSIIHGEVLFGVRDLVSVLSTAGAITLSLVCMPSARLQSSQKLGLAVGTGASVFLCAVRPGNNIPDSTTSRPDLRKVIIIEPYPLLHSIIREKDSRRIFYFMCLNFGFMLVQLSYGFLTGSLGLLSDSIHMFFDCLALVVGLCAAVMSKWPSSPRFPYGYGKVDTLSGFANGVFLMIISIEIIYEAIERLFSGSEMHRIGELLVVSFAGLLVNIIGIMSFDHGHAHGHDHGHSHDHGNENMHGIFLHILADTLGSVAVVISTVLVHLYSWSGFDPLASCLIAALIFASSVPLVKSTAKTLLLTLPADVEYSLRDTLAGVSTLKGVAGYTVPKFWLDDTVTGDSDGHDHCDGDHDGHHHHHHHHHHGHDHEHTHSHDHGHDHSHSHGHNYSHHGHEQQPKVLGVIHVIASRGSDLEDVRQRTINFLKEKNMDILVQVEREGDGHCWCGGGNKT
ncbi:putative zinc transporter msc2 [Monascus purpureus]|uniref:Zinc transporter n=1 Tax=Monascus purpureus TaxID=5098 RepID=A0A507QU85_MONPU|nr:putative zinc transporter msc2 [Monascus purpureus]